MTKAPIINSFLYFVSVDGLKALPDDPKKTNRTLQDVAAFISFQERRQGIQVLNCRIQYCPPTADSGPGYLVYCSVLGDHDRLDQVWLEWCDLALTPKAGAKAKKILQSKSCLVPREFPVKPQDRKIEYTLILAELEDKLLFLEGDFDAFCFFSSENHTTVSFILYQTVILEFLGSSPSPWAILYPISPDSLRLPYNYNSTGKRFLLNLFVPQLPDSASCNTLNGLVYAAQYWEVCAIDALYSLFFTRESLVTYCYQEFILRDVLAPRADDQNEDDDEPQLF